MCILLQNALSTCYAKSTYYGAKILQADANGMNIATVQVKIRATWKKRSNMNMDITTENNANMSLYKSKAEELLHVGSRQAEG